MADDDSLQAALGKLAISPTPPVLATAPVVTHKPVVRPVKYAVKMCSCEGGSIPLAQCWQTVKAKQIAKDESIHKKRASHTTLTYNEKRKCMLCVLSGHSAGACWKPKKEEQEGAGPKI